MNRSEANALITKSLPGDAMQELEHRQTARHETISQELDDYGETDLEPMDLVDALKATANYLEDLLGEYPEPSERRLLQSMLKPIRKVLLLIGYYRPATSDELENTYVFSCRTGRESRVKFLRIDGVAVIEDSEFTLT